MAEIYGVDWERLVQERNDWVAHNFPNQRAPLDSILGCIEEQGELAHAELKSFQNIRGDKDSHVLSAQDAVGDLTVYLLGIIGHFGCRIRGIKDFTKSADDTDGLIKLLANRVGSLSLTVHNPELYVNQIIVILAEFCSAKGWDYGKIVNSTWDSVKERDWIAYPGTGLPEAVAAGG